MLTQLITQALTQALTQILNSVFTHFWQARLKLRHIGTYQTIVETSGTYRTINQLSDRKRQVTVWARDLLNRDDWCVLDTESTGVSRSDEIIQVAVVAPNGDVLFDRKVNPAKASINHQAQKVHGISMKDLRGSPNFDEVLVDLLKSVGERELIAYNTSFDHRLIVQSLQACGISLHLPDRMWLNGKRWYCLMKAYSQWLEISQWRKLPGATHEGVGDCQACLRLIKDIAAGMD